MNAMILTLVFALAANVGVPGKCVTKAAPLKAGKKHGQEWKCAAKGAWKAVLSFKDGAKHGRQLKWYHSGGVAMHPFLLPGRRKPKGPVLSAKEFFVKGQKHGKQLYWHGNGYKKSEEYYQHGKRDGTQLSWFSSGKQAKLVSYRMGQKHGVAYEWYGVDATAPVSMFPKKGKPDPVNRKKKQKHHYANGVQHGKQQAWFRSGKKRYELMFNAGKQHGMQYRWYHNGKKKSVLSYAQGVLHGPCRKWSRGGDFWARMFFEKGKHNGKQTVWLRGGKMRLEYEYQKGRLFQLVRCTKRRCQTLCNKVKACQRYRLQ